MPRKKNDLETIPLQLSTNPMVVSYLNDLVKSGLYGKNIHEAAEQLVRIAIRDLIDSGKLIQKK